MAVPNFAILWPVRFAGSDNALSVTTDATGTATTETLSRTITAGRNMWAAGDDQADAATYGGVGDLIDWFERLLNAHTDAGGQTYEVTLSAAGVVTVEIDAGEFQLRFSDGTTSLDPTWLGFTSAVYTSASSTLTAPNQCRGWFAPARPVSADSRDRQPYVITRAATMDGTTRTARLTAPHKHREIAWRNMPQRYSLAEYADAAEPTGTAEHVWSEAASLGRRLRVYPDAATRTSSSYDLYHARTLEDPISRSSINITRWDFALELSRADYT